MVEVLVVEVKEGEPSCRAGELQVVFRTEALVHCRE